MTRWHLALLPLLAWPALADAQTESGGRTRSVRIITDTPPAIKVPNPAQLAVDLAQGSDVGLGSRVVFRIDTKKPGYLILLDVSRDGKVTQIYPNLQSMAMPVGATQDSNLVKPGKTVSLPDLNNPLARFEFVVEPPAERGLIVALLSPQPVQMIDMPDVPQGRVESGQGLDFIAEAAAQLRLPSPTGGDMVAPDWSVAGRGYQIH